MFETLNVIISSMVLLGLPVMGIMLIKEIVTLWKL